ncbi:hypothetical protein BH09MYX1_BH09MYX1_21350 [soil metagenome]
MRTTFASVLVFGALAAISGCEDSKNGGDVASADSKAGAAASDFTTRDTKGNTFRLSDHLGKEAILIDFWATWCQPCIAEMPHLQRMYDAKKGQGFLVVAVSMDGPESMPDVTSFGSRNNLTFPILLDEDSRIASTYNPRKSAPLSVLIDKNGKIAAVREGYNPGDEAYLEKDVDKVLAPSAAAPVTTTATVTASAAPAASTTPPAK